MKKSRRRRADYWQPLQKADALAPPSEALVRAFVEERNCSRAEALELIKADEDQCDYWVNDLYQVERRLYKDAAGTMIAQLNIRRRDGRAILRDWRHFQRIKNELCGPEYEGVELYPAEARLVDTTNKYHLWVVMDPEFRFGFGFGHRDVHEGPGEDEPGLRQRPILHPNLK